MKRLILAVFVVCFFVTSWAAACCCRKPYVVYQTGFSPNGKLTAYVAECDIRTVSPTDGSFRSVEVMRWSNSRCKCECFHQPDNTAGCLHKKKIYTKIGKFSLADFHAILKMEFSPDSRYLAVVTYRNIHIFEPKACKQWIMDTPAEEIRGFTWCSNTEIAYCLAPDIDDEPTRESWIKIVRQSIMPKSTPTEIYHEFDRYIDNVYWSPDGKQALLGPMGPGRCVMVNLRTKKAKEFGPRNIVLASASWKNDASAVLCSIQKVKPLTLEEQARPLSRIFDKPTGHILMLVKPNGKIVKRYAGKKANKVAPKLSPRWTDDDKFVVAGDSPSSCQLIRPKPWQPNRGINLTRKLAKKFPNLRDYEPPLARPLGVSGWLAMRNRNGNSFAIDYKCKRVVKLAGKRQWAVSDDGKRITMVNPDGTVIVRDLKLP